MLTDIEEIKRRMQRGRALHNSGNGWWIGRLYHVHGAVNFDEVPADLVALMGAQGHIEIKMWLSGIAKWRQPEITHTGDAS